MKIFNGCLAFLLSLSLLSCENAEQQNPLTSENEEILSLFTVQQTTEALGVFDKFNAEKLIVEKTPDSHLFRLQGNSIIGLKSNNYPISALVFKVEGGKFFLQGHESNYISISDGKPKITAAGQTTDLLEIDPAPHSDELNLLILGFLELTTPNEKRTKAKVLDPSHRVQCSFWGTYYLTSINTSRSTTVDQLATGVASGQYNAGCAKIGGVDVSCFFESHFCVATQAYCCDK